VVCEVNEKGFSLVELLVVLAIMIIVMTIGSFSYREAMRGYRVKKAATDVKTLFHYARTTAAKENKLVFVKLEKDGDGFNFDVYLDDNSGDLDATKDELLSRVRLQSDSLDPGRPSGVKSYIFDPYVTLIGTGSITFSQNIEIEEDKTSVSFVNELTCTVKQTGFFDNLGDSFTALLFRNVKDVADDLEDRQYALLIGKTGIVELYKYNIDDDKWELY